MQLVVTKTGSRPPRLLLQLSKEQPSIRAWLEVATPPGKQLLLWLEGKRASDAEAPGKSAVKFSGCFKLIVKQSHY